MNYKQYDYGIQGEWPNRPRRRSTGWIILHRITVGEGIPGIVDFFRNDPEGVATVTIGSLEKRLDAIRDWRSGGVPVWARRRSFVPYNFLVDRNGEIGMMMDVNAMGAHCAGFNSHSVGVGVVGDFRKREPSAPQKLGVKKLCRNLIRKYSKELDETNPIMTHDDARRQRGQKKKNCPGPLFPVDDVASWAVNASKIMSLDPSERW